MNALRKTVLLAGLGLLASTAFAAVDDDMKALASKSGCLTCHAIEAGMGYGVWLHGEGVAAGTMLAADLSHRMGNITEADVERIGALFQRAKLPTVAPDLGVEAYMNYMGVDKKVEAGKMRFVLFRKVGECYVTADAPAGSLRETLMGATGPILR